MYSCLLGTILVRYKAYTTLPNHKWSIIIIVYVVLSMCRWLVTFPGLYLSLLYVALCLFPVGWVLGVLPPLYVLLTWLMEQILTRLLGGSPMATDLRYAQQIYILSCLFYQCLHLQVRNSICSYYCNSDHWSSYNEWYSISAVSNCLWLSSQ